jgi:hypothetical protein
VDMATRIRRAWRQLPACTAGRSPATIAFLEGVREWLTTRVPQVSAKVRTALPDARGGTLFLTCALDTMATRRSAVRDLLSAVQRDDTRDPERFLKVVDDLARALAVFKDLDSGCPTCQSGDLEMWSDEGGSIVLVCDFMGCTHDGSLHPWSGSPHALHPATRTQVLARYPAADLLGNSSVTG